MDEKTYIMGFTGANKRIVLCAASIQHRKCAPVTAQARPVIYC